MVKPPSCRYRDPPEVLKLISRRKEAVDLPERDRLVKQTREARAEAEVEHKTQLLEAAQKGDRRAIGFL